jgi:hypothetical protein
VLGSDGTRQHVVRVLDQEHALVVERIFGLCAEGAGTTRIAKTLNAEAVLRRGVPQAGPPRESARSSCEISTGAW